MSSLIILSPLDTHRFHRMGLYQLYKAGQIVDPIVVILIVISQLIQNAILRMMLSIRRTVIREWIEAIGFRKLIHRKVKAVH